VIGVLALFAVVVVPCDSARINRPHRRPKTFAVVDFSPYPGYSGPEVSGKIMIKQSKAKGVPSQILTWFLTGTDDACPTGTGNVCGIHIHVGKTCDNHTEIGGHLWNKETAGEEDPWTDVRYSSSSGKSFEKRGVEIATGLLPADIIGRSVVVHNSLGAGDRFACGIIKAMPKPSPKPMCGRTLMAFKATCGKKGDDCSACVEKGKSKLEDACGDKADRLSQTICKAPGASKEEDVHVSAVLPIAVEDCGGADHVAKIIDYEPKSLSTGATTMLTTTGAASESIAGGSLNLVVKMTGFPWSTLAEIKDADICQKVSAELWSGFIYGGEIEWQGLDCPVSAGEVTAKFKATISSSIPSGLMNAKVEIDATGLDGKPLLCATSTMGR